jgi:hypothetical protein
MSISQSELLLLIYDLNARLKDVENQQILSVKFYNTVYFIPDSSFIMKPLLAIGYGEGGI